MAKESFEVCLSDTKRCAELFQGLKLSPWQPDILRLEEELPIDTVYSEESLQNLTVSSKMSCSVCGCDFQSRLQQTEHYKLDWHRFNLKQSMMGAESVSEERFEAMTGDISSISGSDVSDDETTSGQPLATPDSPQRAPASDNDDGDNEQKTSRRGSPKIFFENGKGQLVAIYRCLLQWKKETSLTQSELVSRASGLQENQKWAILMAAGGHFAAAIFEGSEVVTHKTFHRYTVRAKRGTAQGVRDNQGGSAPRSAGASLRRYNESQLREDVANLLQSWKDHLGGCSHVFIRAPSYNRTLFFGGKNAPLRRDDTRIRTMPFPTRRPTLKEVKRVHGLLNPLECFENVDAARGKFFTPSKAVRSTPDQRGANEQGITKVANQDLLTDRVNGVTDVMRDDQSSEEEVELIWEEVTSLTSNLKEMEVSVPRKPRRRKKKNNQLIEEDGVKDKELRRLQAAIYTCCKTGEGESFVSLMTQLRKKICLDLEKHGLEKTSSHLETDRPECGKDNGAMTPVQGTPSVSDGANEVPRVLDGVARETLEALGCERVSASSDDPQAGLKGIPSSASSGTLITHPEGTSSGQVPQGQPHHPSREVEERVASFLNEKLDPNQNRLLHIAASSGQVSLVGQLMANGADPNIKNAGGHHPITLANGKNTRLEFSRFMGEHPDKFDYKAARIPPPLTEEEEAAKAAKMREKKKMQRKARGARRKEKKEEKQREEQEEKERQAFVALSDREKRALAAERRLASQLHSTNRCFSCGAELDGKVPFHYQDFKFCAMPCLKKHKQQQQAG